jgi:hypothetical protein
MKRPLIGRLLVGWLAPASVTALALATAAPTAAGDLGVWMLVAAASAAAVAWEQRREQVRLAQADALFDRLLVREEHARGAEAQLSAELDRMRAMIADPSTEARRARLRGITVSADVAIGDRRVPVMLRDLTLHDVWLEVPEQEHARWVPGLPMRIVLQIAGEPHPLGWACAESHIKAPPGHPPVWKLRWRQPLREGELPRALWRAVVHRDAHRVSPGQGVRGVLHLPGGPRTVVIADLSASGVGVLAGIDAREAGRLPERMQLELTLPEHPERLTMSCRLRHVDVRDREAHLGLAFDDAAPAFAEHQPRIASHVMRRDTDRVAVRPEARQAAS